MCLDSNETLLNVLGRTGLFSPEQVEEVFRELTPYYRSPESLGRYLVEIEWLTAYQFELLQTGQWRELTLGDYQILDRLGEGGVSEVFKAWDTIEGRFVALKVLKQDVDDQDEVVRQFYREVHALSRLNHTNIIKLYAAYQDEREYFAMEFVEGMDLDRLIAQVGPLPVDQACDYVRQAAQGLQAAHQVGLVHRDIKPANLFVIHPPIPSCNGHLGRRGPDPVVKIIDWGLARFEPQSDPGNANDAITPLDADRSSLIGTADYIAPEQASDPTLVDIRADIYSLGCTLFYLLTGQPPFQGTTLMQKLMQHQTAEPPSLKQFRLDIPDELDALVLRMLAKNPQDRPQIPLLVLTPLRKFCLPQPGSSGTIRPISASSSVALRPPIPGRVGPAPATSLELPRRGGQGVEQTARPSTMTNILRPGQAPSTVTNLPRPDGHGFPGTRR